MSARGMRRDVPPILGVLVILVALTTVEVLYWRGLIDSSSEPRPGAGREPEREQASAPAGVADYRVTTVAGRPEAGRREGPSDQARFDGPAAVAVAESGEVAYVADSRNHSVRMVGLGAASVVTTLAGVAGKQGFADGRAAEALFSAPAGVAVAPDGSVLVADTGNHRIRRIRDGVVSTIAGSATPRDDLGRELGGYRDGPAGQAQFCYPVGLVADQNGDIYVADAGNHRVRRISAGGLVTSIPTEGKAGMKAPTAVALATNGDLWVADTAGGTLWMGPCEGPLKEERPPAEIGFGRPAGIAVGVADIPEYGAIVSDADNHCLWHVGEEGWTLAAGVQDPNTPGWQDGPGNEALFSCPAGLAAGPDGLAYVYVADFGNNSLRRVERGGG